MYNNRKGKVMMPHEEIYLSEILTGGLRGDIFVIVGDFALRAIIGGKDEEVGF